MKNLLLIVLVSSILLSCSECEKQEKSFPLLKGEYLGQTPPGNEPELFAPGIVSGRFYNRDIAMTPDGKEIYFCVIASGYKYTAICETKLLDGVWTEPEVSAFSKDPGYRYIEPFISPDGKRFFFLCNKPDTAKGETELDTDIWVMDREGDKWGNAYNLGEPINTADDEFFPSVTNDGTIYFTRAKKDKGGDQIFRAKLANGKYQGPEKLPVQINSGKARYNAFIAPDESYCIVPVFGREDSYGATDYYISYIKPDDTWTEPINLGSKINTKGWQEYSPYVSPDGKYFFFMAARDNKQWEDSFKVNSIDKMREYYDSPTNGLPSIYWVSTSFIEELKPDELKK
ncbi:MAG: PD40 domain-containing protein [Melioribacteraceae bacterium]|nr:PD40 domain-containing protein [Melioribacteraceae bacterium]